MFFLKNFEKKYEKFQNNERIDLKIINLRFSNKKHSSTEKIKKKQIKKI